MAQQQKVKPRKASGRRSRERNTEPRERPEIHKDVWARWFKEDC